MRTYVLAGPTRIGNMFGTFGRLVPAGKFAVVSDGEYNNGGYGPSLVKTDMVFDSEEAALAALESHLQLARE